MFKRLIDGVPTAIEWRLSPRRQGAGNLYSLFVASGLAVLTPALLLLSGCSENTTELPAAQHVTARKVISTPQTKPATARRAELESESDDFIADIESDSIEVLSDKFLALAEDDATLTDQADDTVELTGPWGCPRLSNETRIAAAPQRTPQRVRSPIAALPLPAEFSDLAPELPVLPEVLPEALVQTDSGEVVTTSKIADSTEADLPLVDDEPAPLTKPKPKVDAGVIRLVAMLEAEDIKQLVVRARLELAAGDVLLAHRFAEAAAEVPIPLELFQQRPLAVLDEIEFTRQVRNVAQTDELPSADSAAATEPTGDVSPLLGEDPSLAQAPAEKPTESAAPVAKPRGPRPTERIKTTPRAFQAIGRASLNVLPRSLEDDGQAPRVPASEARKRLAELPTLEHTIGTGRNWGSTVYSWDAPSLFHSPLYFEDVQLERYGNEIAIVQPVISGIHFLKDVATLPYQMGIEGNGPTGEVYDLGHDRPGDCVRYSWQRLPVSATGALTQAGAMLGLIYIIP